MIRFDRDLEAPAVVRHNQEAIAKIVNCVQEGIYCAVLGPRLSGKTLLLHYVRDVLAGGLGWACVYVDLYEIRATTLQGFFANLIELTAVGIARLTGVELAGPEPATASSAVFRGFLEEALVGLGRDLVLIVEHLEALPSDMVQALLTSLRAAYMDQQSNPNRVVVVISGALSLASLTVGESSPFRGIARRVFIGDLSRQDSADLIVEELSLGEVRATRRALRQLLRAASGDPFLIRQLCARGLEEARADPETVLRGTGVKRLVRTFLRREVLQYAPLLEAVRLIEEDPDLLGCILRLLAHGTVPKSQLPLPLSPDLDPLYLTGVVEQVGDDAYRIQNTIYRRFLQRHFQPGHVGHVLSMAGRWDSALDYLEAGARRGNKAARADILPATINSMYAAEDISRAAHYLIRGLSAAFDMVEARVWYAVLQEDRLRLVSHMGPEPNAALWTSPEMAVTDDRLEARAYRQGRALRGREGDRHVWRAIPLVVQGRKPLGVVTLCDDHLGGRLVQQRERDLLLNGYLSQAARALQAVTTRRQELALAGRMQNSLLPAGPPDLPGWGFAAVLQPARETSGDFYDYIPLPMGRLGLVVADVADKGMGAALYMAMSRTLLRTYASQHPGRPDLALEAANARMLADTGAGLFVTVFYGILDPASGTLTYTNAGHHPPYLLRPGFAEPLVALPDHGIALGVVDEPGWDRTAVELPPGTSLLLYTDGVVDAMNPEQVRFGDEGLARLLADQQASSAEALRDEILIGLQQFRGEEPQFDDITLLAVHREQ